MKNLHFVLGYEAEIYGTLVSVVGDGVRGLARYVSCVRDAACGKHCLIGIGALLGVVVAGSEYGISHLLKAEDQVADHLDLYDICGGVCPVKVTVDVYVAEACGLVFQDRPGTGTVHNVNVIVKLRGHVGGF